jgi:hypothetical protein
MYAEMQLFGSRVAKLAFFFKKLGWLHKIHLAFSWRFYMLKLSAQK